MATQNLDIRDFAESGDWLDVWASPVFFGFDDVGESGDWALLGRYAVLGVLVSTGDDADALAAGVRHGVPIADAGDSADALALTAKVVPVVTFEAADEGDSADALIVSGLFVLTIADAGNSADALNVGQALIPTLREPLPGEVAGAVNLVRNPSVETDLTDWSADVGVTLARDGAEAWAGDWAALATYPATVAMAAIHVATVREIGDAAAMAAAIGSIAAKNDVPGLALRLTAQYQDASNASVLGAFADAAAADWARLASEALMLDPAKTLDSLTVSVVRAGNRVSNPSLEVNTTGWGAINGAVIARVTDQMSHGIASLKVTPSATTNSGVRYNLTPPVVANAGETVTLGAMVKAPVGMDVQTRIVFRDAALAALFFPSSALFAGTGDWQLVTQTAVAPASTTNLYFDLWRAGTSPAADFWIDAAQVLPLAELPTFDDGAAKTLRLDGAQVEDATTGGATAYVDGDQGDGHEWFGPEHASVSYREPMPA